MSDFEAAERMTDELAAKSTAKKKIAFVRKKYSVIKSVLEDGTTKREYVELLNLNGFEISYDLFRKYWSKVGKEVEEAAKVISVSDMPDTGTPTIQPSAKSTAEIDSKTKPRKKTGIPDYEECPYILKIEAHLKERLPDSLRPYIKIVDGKPVTSFEKGTIRTAEIREYMRRIWNICEDKVVLKG